MLCGTGHLYKIHSLTIKLPQQRLCNQLIQLKNIMVDVESLQSQENKLRKCIVLPFQFLYT